jgi:hypothetical protein
MPRLDVRVSARDIVSVKLNARSMVRFSVKVRLVLL